MSFTYLNTVRRFTKLVRIALSLSLCILCVSCKSAHVFTCDEIKGDYEGYYTDNDSSDWSTKLTVYLERYESKSFGCQLHGRQRELRNRLNKDLENTSGSIDMLYGLGNNSITVMCSSNGGKYNAKGNIELIQDGKDTGIVCINLKVQNPGYFRPGIIILKKIK